MQKRATLIKRDVSSKGTGFMERKGLTKTGWDEPVNNYRLRPAIFDFVGRNAERPVKQKYDYQPLCGRPSALPIRGGGGHLLLGA